MSENWVMGRLHLLQWSSRKLPMVMELWGLRKLRVSPRKGHPMLPWGVFLSFLLKRGVALRMKTSTKKGAESTNQTPPAISPQYLPIPSFSNNVFSLCSLLVKPKPPLYSRRSFGGVPLSPCSFSPFFFCFFFNAPAFADYALAG